MPLFENEVDPSAPFTEDELLFRRVLPSEEHNGEIHPTQLNSVSFQKDVQSSPSVLRGKYASPKDALHSDCAGQKDVSDQSVYSIAVCDLPSTIRSNDGKIYSVFPLHFPLPTCGAHSVISCCLYGDQTKSYVRPSPSARYDLRVKLAAKMQKVSFASGSDPGSSS